MPVNQYFNPKVYEGELYTPPVSFIAAALEGAQKQYDTNFAAAEELRNKYIVSRSADRAQANTLTAGWEKEIDGLVTKYNGDYSQATKELYALKSKMNKSFNPGGAAYAYQSNYTAEQESIKRERERLGKGEVTLDQLTGLENFYQQQKATTYDPKTGAYSNLRTMDLAKYVDEGAIAEKVFSGIKPKKKKVELPSGIGPNGDYTYTTTEVDYIDPNELASSLQTNLFSNDQYVQYMTQMATMKGVDPKTYLDGVIDHYSKNVIPFRSGAMLDSTTIKFVDNWKARKKYDFGYDVAMEGIKQNNRKDLIDYKNAADASEAMGGGQPSLLATQEGIGGQYGQVPLTQSIAPQTSWGMIGDALAPSVEVPLKISDIVSNFRNRKPQPNGVQINVPQLLSIQEANPGMSDGDVLRLYNANISDGGSMQNYEQIFYDKYQSTSAQQEEMDRMMPQLAAGTTDIWKIDLNTGVPVHLDAIQRAKVYPQLLEAKKNKSPNYNALGKTRASSGKVPYGTAFADPTGGSAIYVARENRADIAWLQQYSLDPAFKWIAEGRNQGEPFTLVIDRKEQPIMGATIYHNGKGTVGYFPAHQDANGDYQPDLTDPYMDINPVTGQPILVGPTQMEKKILTQATVHSTFPRKTHKAFENETGS